MSKTVRIPLPEPLPGHKGPITEVVIRRPTFSDYLDCGGEPYSIGQSEEGALFSIEKPETIKAYINALVVEPDTLLLEQSDFLVAREVRKAILGFFQAAAEDSAASPSSPTT
ncbi:hypothetical protein ACLBX9_16625 [Methylobacterium sp. A49B]